MYTGRDWLPCQPGEVESYTLDFVNDVNAPAGEVINTAQWACEAVVGSDPNVGTCLQGSAVITPPAATSQFFSSAAPGVTYRLTATVVTSAGQTLKLYSHVQCQAPA